MGDLVSIFGGSFTPPIKLPPPPADQQLLQAIRDAGLTPPQYVQLDGILHRFNSGEKGKKKNGWYCAYADGVPAGRFGCWKEGIEVAWTAEVDREITDADRMAMSLRQSEAKSKRDAERKLWQEAAADTAEIIWSGCGPANADHPYLATKGIQPHGTRITGDGRLVVPVYDREGEIISLQYIDGEGNKKYAFGGKMVGARFLIGPVNGQTIFVVEGFATGASVHEATQMPTWVAFGKGGLGELATNLRASHGPQANIIIVADNDESGDGYKYAKDAAEKANCRVVMPPVTGDANDYVNNGGDLHTLLFPPVDGWLVSADDFSSQPRPIKWLVKKWLQDEALMMVHGPSGGGKTFVVLDWCMRIASDFSDWNGFKVNNGSVLYLAGEGHHGLRGRIAAWKQHHNVAKLNMWLSQSGCDLNKADGYNRVCESIRALGELPRLIVVDTLHRFLDGSENDTQDARTMIDACGALTREFGCAVLLVHHTGVSDEAQHRARGSSAWKAALEVELSVIPNGESRMISQKKMKDGEEQEPIYIDLQSVAIEGWFDEDGDQVTSVVPVATNPPADKPKKESKLSSFMKIFEAAWWASGAEEYEDKPYVTRAAFYNHLITAMAMSDASAKQNLKPSEPTRIIGSLLVSQIIEPIGNGWRVQDKIFASSLKIAKQG